MSIPIKNDFSGGVNLDLDELRLPPNAAQFLKNVTRTINSNPNASGLAGANKDVVTPLEGNTALTLTLGGGINRCIGFYSSEQTNEGYFFVWNSSNNHSVWVIRGATGVVQKVYQGSLLNFQSDPQYWIAEGRCTMQLISFFNKVTNQQDYFKLLIFCDNFNEDRCISVEDSIATSSFSTSYFTSSAAFYIPETLINLCVPLPIKAIGINSPTPYTPQSGDSTKQNAEIRIAWQFRVKTVDIFGRESEHGIISDQYMTVKGGNCLATANGLARCVNLCFDAGNPLVNYIQVEFRQWKDGTTPFKTDWYIADTISKYDNSGSVAWYNRSINPNIVFDATTNLITYTFCADKESIPIDVEETDRTEPEVPRKSSSIFSMAKRIGAANNVRGFEPISPAELAKITVSAQNPTFNNFCPALPIRKVVIYAVIYDPYDNTKSIMRQSFGKVVFGNSDSGHDCDPGTFPDYTSSFVLDQVFADQVNPGFICYMAGMAGSEYAAVGVQGDFDAITGIFTTQGYGSGITFTHAPVIQFTFYNIPAGGYIARLASHKAKISDGNYQQTSTYLAGTTQVYQLNGDLTTYAQRPLKEIWIFCGDNDVVLNQPTDPMFVILDLGDGVYSSGIDGYLTEGPGGAPIEMNPIWFGAKGPGGGKSFGSFFTDHNGFYFATGDHGVQVKIYSDICTGATTILMKTLYTGGPKQPRMLHGDGTGTNSGPGTSIGAGSCGGVYGYWANTVNFLDRIVGGGGTTAGVYPECGRRRIKMRIETCDTHVGVPGIPVILAFGSAQTTDSNGSIEIVAHNLYNYPSSIGSNTPPVYASSVPPFPGGAYVQPLFTSPSSTCTYYNCDVCKAGLGTVDVPYKDCCTPFGTNCLPLPNCRTTDFGTRFGVRIGTANNTGIQSGGVYQVGVILHDENGRHTFVQKVGTVTANNLNDATYQPTPGVLIFALQSIGYSIGSSFQVPTYFKYMTLGVCANSLFSDFIMLPADWIQKVDNTGATDNVNPTFMRIYYGSLIEYNKQNNYQTNTSWNFQTQSQANPNGVPQEGDVVQFIANGNGTPFTSVVSAAVSYSKDGLFFTIPYDSALSGITNGALFKVIRPKVFQGNDQTYYEQSLTIQLDNTGKVPSGLLTGTLPYYDSYIVTRQMPVPLLAGQSGPIAPGATPTAPIQYSSTGSASTDNLQGSYVTSNAVNYNNVVSMQTVDSQTNFPFFFESPSPSDFWGNHVANRGRVFIANPYEQERRIGTEIALSDTVSDRGILNGISYFESQNAEVFDKNTFGDITSVLVEMGVLMVICKNDFFNTRYNQTQLQIDSAGNVSAQNPQGTVFTAPQQKIGKNYGCILADINTIRKFDGMVIFLDAKGHLIFSNFSDAKAVEYDGYQAYLLEKISFTNLRNLSPNANGTTYFVGGVNPKTMQYALTNLNIPVAGPPNFLNTQYAPLLAANETWLFDMTTGQMVGNPSYTPEMYGLIPGYFSQRQFLSFKQGAPYIHNQNLVTSTTPYANFYGVQCDCAITIVANVGPDKVKRYFYMEIYTRQNISNGSGVLPSVLFYTDAVSTEKLQSSRLLVPQWDIRNGFQVAYFLCDLNTPFDPNLQPQTTTHKIWDGNPLIGRWLKAILKTNPSWAGTYFELTSAVIYSNGVEKSAG